MKSLRSSTMAALLVAVCFVLSADPAAAHNPFPAQFYNPVGAATAGVLVLEDDFQSNWDAIPLDEGACLPADSISLQQGSPNPTSFRINTFDTRHQFQWARGYQMDLEVTNAPVTGTYSSAFKTVLVGGVALQLSIYEDDDADCRLDVGDVLVCDLDVVVDMAGSFTGTGHDAGDAYSLGVVTASGEAITSSSGVCNSPFASYLDGIVNTTDTTNGGDDLNLMVG